MNLKWLIVGALNFEVIQVTRKEFRIFLCIVFILAGESMKRETDVMESKECSFLDRSQVTI